MLSHRRHRRHHHRRRRHVLQVVVGEFPLATPERERKRRQRQRRAAAASEDKWRAAFGRLGVRVLMWRSNFGALQIARASDDCSRVDGIHSLPQLERSNIFSANQQAQESTRTRDQNDDDDDDNDDNNDDDDDDKRAAACLECARADEGRICTQRCSLRCSSLRVQVSEQETRIVFKLGSIVFFCRYRRSDLPRGHELCRE